MGGGEAVDPLGGGGEVDSVPGLAGADGQPNGQVGLAGAWSDGDRLQHIRAALPCEVRVTAATHPLFEQLLAARDFRRVDGVVFLVVGLPDGSPGTVRADATDVLGVDAAASVVTVLDVNGLRALNHLVRGLQSRLGVPARPRNGK
jgi:hypothetical protein